MTTHRKRRRILAALIWSLLVAVLLAMPGDELPDAGSWDWLDKPAHAVLFAVHCWLLAGALQISRSGDRSLAVAMLGSGLYGVLLEAVQIPTPGRFWDWWDLVADFVGIAVIALLIARSRARLRATS